MKAFVDTGHLSEIMIDYITNPNKVTEHSINAREKIEKDYNWDHRDEDFFCVSHNPFPLVLSLVSFSPGINEMAFFFLQ